MVWSKASELDLRLDPKTGEIAVLRFAGVEFVSPTPTRLPVAEIGFLSGQTKVFARPRIEKIRVNPEVEDNYAASSLAVFEFRFDSCVGLSDECNYPVSGWVRAIIESDGTVRWRVSLTNEASLPVCEILFPRLGPFLLRGEPVLFYPHHAGEKIVNVPKAFASEKYQKFWRAQTERTYYGFCREINYCGLASMTWMDLTDGETGIYAASYDPTFPVTGLRVETGGPDDPWVSLSFRKYVDIPPGESYTSHDVVWALHSGDWHDGAEKYREWFDSHVAQYSHPEDLAEEVVLSPHYNFRRHDGITYRFADIPRIADKDREEFGSRHFFIAGWNHMGFDSHYPNYNPDLELGTPLKLQEGVKYVAENGGFTTFYINCRIMDKYSEYMSTLGERWMLRTEAQKPIEEKYGPAETIVLCPSNPEWRSYLEEFAVWMCQAYGARGIYFDQLGSATPYPCYSDHEHGPVKGTSGFNQGYIDLIERTIKRLRAIRHDSFLMIENCGDIYSSRVWGSLAWNGEMYDEFFNLYKYTFPEHVLVNMVNPRNLPDPDMQEEVFYKDLMRAFVLGSVLWFEGDAFRVRIKEKERQERMLGVLHDALFIRRAVALHLAKVVFWDDVGVTAPEGVKASLWKGKDGENVLLLVNPERKTGRITVTQDYQTLETASADDYRMIDSVSKQWHRHPMVESNQQMNFDLTPAAFAAIRWAEQGRGECNA